jgi:large subunit ribosomal protein L19
VGAIGDVNRAKLYYLRGKVGKKARIRELRQPGRAQKAAEAQPDESADVDTVDAAADTTAE